jgi:hypothetical protein
VKFACSQLCFNLKVGKSIPRNDEAAVLMSLETLEHDMRNEEAIKVKSKADISQRKQVQRRGHHSFLMFG